MSRGSSGGTDNLKLFFIGVRGLKDGEKIHLEQVEALGDKKYNKDLPHINQITGIVHKLETKVRKSDKYGDKDEIVIWLKDIVSEELYCFSCGVNSIGRSIINTLAGIEGNLGELEIGVYTSKTGRPSVYLKHNGAKTSWKYPIDFQKTMVTETSKREKVGNDVVTKIIRDYLDLDAFFLKCFREDVMPKVQNFEAASKDHPEPKPMTDQSEEPQLVASGEDLPF